MLLTTIAQPRQHTKCRLMNTAFFPVARIAYLLRSRSITAVSITMIVNFEMPSKFETVLAVKPIT